MQLIIGILQHTPVWVWLFFAFLIYRGWTMTRTRETKPIILMIIPAIFITLDMSKLIFLNGDLKTLLLTTIGVAIAAVTIALIKPAKTTRRLEDGKLQIRGEWFSISIFTIVFVINYIAAVLAVMQPQIATPFHDTASLINGFCAGFMTLRALTHLRVKSNENAPEISASVNV